MVDGAIVTNAFYGFRTWNLLINPNNPLVQAVLGFGNTLNPRPHSRFGMYNLPGNEASETITTVSSTSACGPSALSHSPNT